MKTKLVETDKIELTIRVPSLLPSNVSQVVLNIRRTLENCASLHLLDEFIETRMVEYREEAN